jgi:aspartate racemase
MKTIGVIGGMSAESTALYYERLNAEVRRRLGGLHSARLIVWSFDFADIATLQQQNRWEEAGDLLANAAIRLERCGAELLVLATNTMHKLADRIESAVGVPLLHIADATAQRISSAGHTRPALMATGYTMEQDFYKGRLRQLYGFEVLVPEADDRRETHRIIYDELCRGLVRDESRRAYEAIAGRLADAGADCLILGCTEVTMLLGPHNVPVPVFDTVSIHVDAAIDAALTEQRAAAA